MDEAENGKNFKLHIGNLALDIQIVPIFITSLLSLAFYRMYSRNSKKKRCTYKYSMVRSIENQQLGVYIAKLTESEVGCTYILGTMKHILPKDLITEPGAGRSQKDPRNLHMNI